MIFSGMARFVTQLFSSHLEEKIGICIPTYSGGPEPNLNLGMAWVCLFLGALGLNKIRVRQAGLMTQLYEKGLKKSEYRVCDFWG